MNKNTLFGVVVFLMIFVGAIACEPSSYSHKYVHGYDRSESKVIKSSVTGKCFEVIAMGYNSGYVRLDEMECP
jgi:hypothetical protein